MTLRELFKSKIIRENVVVVDISDDNRYSAQALRVFDRPVEITDFKGKVEPLLEHEVYAIFGTKDKYKVAIQVVQQKRC